MRTIHIVGNWKANPKTLSDAKELARKVKEQSRKFSRVHVTLAAPTPYLLPIGEIIGRSERMTLAAQDCSSKEAGAHTGEVIAPMLKSVGVSEVIIGHSESRARGVSDGEINARLHQLYKYKLRPILCIGEEKRDLHGAYLQFLSTQLTSALKDIPKAAVKRLIVAYEPLWAIGEHAAVPDTPEGFHHTAIFIRKVLSHLCDAPSALKIPVLYGGSVNVDNASSFLCEGYADGLLVGRASLKAKDFLSIITNAEAVTTSL